MAIYFLYYLNTDTPSPFDWQSMMIRADQVIGMFQWGQVLVDPDGVHAPHSIWPLVVVRSLNEALAHPLLSKLKWVWLDAKANTTLQEYVHPKDNVIYCIGHDATGFEGRSIGDLPGDKLGVWTPDPNREYYAETIIHLVVYDRALKTLWNK